jgi:hypothetical protein
MLTVLNSPPAPPPLVPSGVILAGDTSGFSQTETVSLFNPWGVPLPYSSTVVTDNRINWLAQTPASGTLAAGATGAMTLQANLKGLTPGLQHAVMRVAFIDGTVHTVDVYLIVPPGMVSASSRTSTELLSPSSVQPDVVAQSCPGSTGIALVLRSPEPGFQVTAQVPVPLQAIARDCATGKLLKQLSGALVQVTAGSQNLSLIDDGSGTWTGTWTPAEAANQIRVTARVDQYVGSAASVVSSQDTITGTVNSSN